MAISLYQTKSVKNFLISNASSILALDHQKQRVIPNIIVFIDHAVKHIHTQILIKIKLYKIFLLICTQI